MQMNNRSTEIYYGNEILNVINSFFRDNYTYYALSSLKLLHLQTVTKLTAWKVIFEKTQ